MAISAYDFYRRLNNYNSNGTTTIASIEINEDVHIDVNTFSGKVLNLINCNFFGKFTFDSLPNIQGVKFESCTFNILSFNNISFSYIDGKSVDEGRIAFIRSTVTDLLVIDKCILGKNILIENNCNIKDLILTESQLDSVLISKSTVGHNLQIQKCNISTYINIESSEIQGRTIITQTECNYISFNKSHHIISIEIAGGEIRETLDFYQAIVDGEAIIVGVISSDDIQKPSSCLYFRDSTFKKSVSISYPTGNIYKGFQNILLRDTSFENGLSIKGADSQTSLCDINKINIDCSRKLMGEISLQNFRVVSTYINGINSDASIIFNNIQFFNLSLVNYTNKGNLQFINTSPANNVSSVLTIKNSILGNTQFASTSLANYSSFSIENSDLTSISSSSTKWFTIKQLRGAKWPKVKFLQTLKMVIPTSERNVYYNYCQQQRELFRQLKFAMEKQGDRIQNLIFKQYEMIAYRQELNISVGRYDEKFIMLLNRSNSYGQNWWKPVLWAIGFTGLFYYLITISQSPEINGIDFTRGGVSHLLDVLWKNFSVFFQILNPVHVIDKINEGAKDISKMTYFLDYFYRIILSYLIFQTISAFRKYVK